MPDIVRPPDAIPPRFFYRLFHPSAGTSTTFFGEFMFAMGVHSIVTRGRGRNPLQKV